VAKTSRVRRNGKSGKTKDRSGKAKDTSGKANDTSGKAEASHPIVAVLTRFKWLFAAVLSFVLFLFTPIGEDLQARAYGVFYPFFSKVSDGITRRVGLVPVQTLNRNVFTPPELAVAVDIIDGQPTPEHGCADISWGRTSGAKPLISRLYTELLANRSNVFLTAATLKLNRLPSNAKAVAICNEGGGEDETTKFLYRVSATEGTKLTISGPGTTDEGNQVVLGLNPGKKYPVTVEVRVDGPVVVDWSSELVFKVDGVPHRVNIGNATTAGVDPSLPRFVADGGRWRKTKGS
jgi:hypothetical protein